MRTNTGCNVAKSDEMSMRLSDGHQEGGLSTKQAPILTKLDNKKAVGAVSSLRL